MDLKRNKLKNMEVRKFTNYVIYWVDVADITKLMRQFYVEAMQKVLKKYTLLPNTLSNQC